MTKALSTEKQSHDLDSITDYHEETELDTTKIQEEIKHLVAIREAQKAQEAQRKKELMAIPIKNEDVDIIVQEMEIPRDAAELALRKHKGNLEAALRTLIAE